MQAYTPLNGSVTSKGNYLWGGALTLAWKQLYKDILKGVIKVNSNSDAVLQLVSNFNKSPFQSNMLSESCYYARAGFGNQTVNRINEQVTKKFAQKTTAKLQPNLEPTSIISYAYFFKKLQFKYPFAKQQVLFKNNEVAGFAASNASQRKQVFVHQYQNDENFMIQLGSKSEVDHIFIIKNQKQLSTQQVLHMVHEKAKANAPPIAQKQIFKMPKVSVHSSRNLNELLGVFLTNPGFEQYRFDQIYEIIKLDIDETGVKVENEGVIVMTKAMVMKPQKIRRFVIDKPFWVVMRQKNNHPYFVAHISSVEDK